MNTEQHSNTTVRLVVDELDPQLVEIHDAPNIAVTLTAGGTNPFVYLVGTPDQLHWLCDKLRAIVTAHESATKLAGEAAARVAAEAAARDEHEYHVGHGYYPRTCAACAALPNLGRPVDASTGASS